MKTPDEDKLKELQEDWQKYLKYLPLAKNNETINLFLEKLKEMDEAVKEDD